MTRPPLALALVCVLARLGAALQLGAAPPVNQAVRLASPCMSEGVEAKRCAMISLSADDPLRLAKVLKRAWMEGGVKRGLVGSVLVGKDTVKIACQGKVARLQSFANWIEESSMLVTGVDIVDIDECPLEELTTKFPLAAAEGWSGGIEGSFAGDLASKLKSLSLEIQTKQGTSHSNDEGLF
jgi:acylphosphatase